MDPAQQSKPQPISHRTDTTLMLIWSKTGAIYQLCYPKLQLSFRIHKIDFIRYRINTIPKTTCISDRSLSFGYSKEETRWRRVHTHRLDVCLNPRITWFSDYVIDCWTKQNDNSNHFQSLSSKKSQESVWIRQELIFFGWIFLNARRIHG